MEARDLEHVLEHAGVFEVLVLTLEDAKRRSTASAMAPSGGIGQPASPQASSAFPIPVETFGDRPAKEMAQFLRYFPDC